MSDGDEDIDDELPDFSKDPTFTGCDSYTIIYAYCPKCGKKNYVTQGYKWDIEVVECWNCGTEGWLNSDIRDESQCAYDCMDAAMSEKGREKP